MRTVFYRELGVTLGWLALFLVVGGAWIGWVQRTVGTDGTSIIVSVAALLISGLFVWMLFTHVRAVLRDPHTLVPRLLFVLVDVVLYVLMYAWVYSSLGIVDDTGSSPGVTYDFRTCVYYSIVTISTVGYGDFFPTPAVRFVAAIQGTTGYVMLAILASTGLSALSRRVELRQEDD